MVANLMISLLVALLSICFLVMSRHLPHISSVDPAGPALFPVVVASVALLSIFLDLLIRVVKDTSYLKKVGIEFVSLFSDNQKTTTFRMGMVLILSAIYPYFIVNAGFVASTACYMFALQRIFKLPLISSAVISTLMAVFLNFIFVYLLQATVPEGEWLYSLGIIN